MVEKEIHKFIAFLQFSVTVFVYKRRVAESANRAEQKEHLSKLSDRSGGLDGLYH